MKHRVLLAGAVLVALCNFVWAGSTSPSHPGGPYAGQETREIKTLSPAEIEAYLAGEGSGLAKAAELNHYPGPAHVLELAGALALTPAQHERTEKIFRAMRAAARDLGAELVRRERALDRLFASGEATSESLRAALARIGHTHTALRRVHLQAHLEQRAVLTKEQVRHYDRLRGYGGGTGGHRHERKH